MKKMLEKQIEERVGTYAKEQGFLCTSSPVPSGQQCLTGCTSTPEGSCSSLSSNMRDHKGYEVKDSMDWRDKLILWTCVVVAILTVMLGGL